jgi:hypothetical protein
MHNTLVLHPSIESDRPPAQRQHTHTRQRDRPAIPSSHGRACLGCGPRFASGSTMSPTRER